MEGLCFKRLEESYRGGVRSWRKYKVRVTTEAVIGAVTGSLAAPRTLLLGRYDTAGRLQYIGRSTTLSRAAGRAVADHLAPPHGAHQWRGWTFSAGWGTQRTLDAVLVQPEVVMEVDVDVARDSAGRWRHLVMSQDRAMIGSMVGPTTAAAVSSWRRSRAAQPYAGLTGIPRRLLRCGRRPPVGEQLLESERGGVVGGRDVDDKQARLAHVRLVDRVRVRHYARRPWASSAAAVSSPDRVAGRQRMIRRIPAGPRSGYVRR